ncbi:hypothetical protein [Tenacibaculum sp. SG-28]|uniref:hypothetical protein n=1 Tax=Tenacibaculum sp. SG-28 TaxID=754426 RepID=UPI000CF42923|nr:hypothetical protein [Tenacibaculum sp. SG-28]PQJ23368.1 hypothetical protein BSU00_04020 [Tenacibaculum sp. SG-28]
MTNEVKHNNLNKTENKDKVQSVNLPGAFHVSDTSNISFTNTLVNGKKVEDLVIKNGEIVSSIDVQFKIVKENKMFFLNREIEIIPFLKKALSEVDNIKQRMYSVLNEKVN